MKKPVLRQCVCCREMFDKRALTRFVINDDKDVAFDLTGKSNGRGFYFCNKCLDNNGKFVDKKMFSKAIKANFSDDKYNELKIEYDRIRKNK